MTDRSSPSPSRNPIRWGLTEWTRAAAILVGTYGSLFASSADKGTILAFAGALLIAPNIVGAQEKRNQKRDGD
jgi:hypothetical protein